MGDDLGQAAVQEAIKLVEAIVTVDMLLNLCQVAGQLPFPVIAVIAVSVSSTLIQGAYQDACLVIAEFIVGMQDNVRLGGGITGEHNLVRFHLGVTLVLVGVFL
jgi:hypothetical protein